MYLYQNLEILDSQKVHLSLDALVCQLHIKRSSKTKHGFRRPFDCWISNPNYACSIPVNPTRGIRARVRRVGIAVAVDRLAVLINDGRSRRGVDGNGFVDGGLGMDVQVEDGSAPVRGFGVETAAKCGQREGVEQELLHGFPSFITKR